MLILSHPTGNANVRAALKTFEEAHRLLGFFTSLGFSHESLSHLPQAIAMRLQRRAYDLPADRIHSRAVREAARLLSHERLINIDEVYLDLDKHVAQWLKKHGKQRDIRALYAYEDGADISFHTAQSMGIHCLYEQPIGYWRAAQRIYQEEAERLPEWAASLPGLQDSPEKLARKDRELSMADHVFAASTFTRDTLLEYPGELPPVSVIPYGCPEPITKLPQRHPTTKLRVLFVGGLSQRKGLSYLFEAMTGLESVADLTIIGRKPQAACPALDAALARHHWIETLPNEKILALMQDSDVLVFPSLFEGFGLVLIEALSQGIPIIATPHTAAPDIIVDGQEGFIVPIRDALAIREKLLLLAEEPDRLAAMKLAAWQHAHELSWSLYAKRLLHTTEPYLGHAY